MCWKDWLDYDFRLDTEEEREQVNQNGSIQDRSKDKGLADNKSTP